MSWFSHKFLPQILWSWYCSWVFWYAAAFSFKITLKYFLLFLDVDGSLFLKSFVWWNFNKKNIFFEKGTMLVLISEWWYFLMKYIFFFFLYANFFQQNNLKMLIFSSLFFAKGPNLKKKYNALKNCLVFSSSKVVKFCLVFKIQKHHFEHFWKTLDVMFLDFQN